MAFESTGFKGRTQAQSELIEHWQARGVGMRPPAREQLDPGAIRAHLSAISIVEIGARGRAKFRLAGSALRTIFGREMRGRFLTDLDRDMFEMWSLGLSSVLDQRRPVGGLIERDTDMHAWLRLPLQSGEQGAVILCHDSLIPSARLRREYDAVSHKNQIFVNNIAA